MSRPRIFLGSSGKQAKLLQAITHGLEDVVDVEPWTTTFNPDAPPSTGSSSSPRRSTSPRSCSPRTTGPRPMRPSPARRRRATTWSSRPGYSAARSASAHVHPPRERLQAANRSARADLRPLRPGHEPGGSSGDQPEAPQGDRERRPPRPCRRAVVAALADGAERGRTFGGEPPAYLAGPRRWPHRDRPGLAGGRHPSARYCSEAAKERKDPAGIVYFWNERPRDPNAPQLEGTGEITVESIDRANGYFTTRSDRDAGMHFRTPGVIFEPSLRPRVLEGGSEDERAQLIAQRLQEWKAAGTHSEHRGRSGRAIRALPPMAWRSPRRAHRSSSRSP